MSTGRPVGPLVYGELASFYHLIDPAEDHREECEDAYATLRAAVQGPLDTLLELGAGAGNNGLHLKRHLRCVLTDISEPMLALSRARNPECEHALGDMRTLRLGRTFDAVLVHDAIVYMTTVEDLAAAAATVFAHLRPGGAAIVMPDGTRETSEEEHQLVEGDDDVRSIRGVIWGWFPEDGGTTGREEFMLMVREGGVLRAVHETHTFGVFPRAVWHDVFTRAGFVVTRYDRTSEGDPYDTFLCVRPASG